MSYCIRIPRTAQSLLNHVLSRAVTLSLSIASACNSSPRINITSLFLVVFACWSLPPHTYIILFLCSVQAPGTRKWYCYEVLRKGRRTASRIAKLERQSETQNVGWLLSWTGKTITYSMRRRVVRKKCKKYENDINMARVNTYTSRVHSGERVIHDVRILYSQITFANFERVKVT